VRDRRTLDLIALGRDTAELALRLCGGNRATPFSDSERRIVLASLIRTALGTGLVSIDDVEKQLRDDEDFCGECMGEPPRKAVTP
jgi:hypothetical protein